MTARPLIGRRLRVFMVVLGAILVALGLPVLAVASVQGSSVILLGLDMVIPGVALILVARTGPRRDRRLKARRRARPPVGRADVVGRDASFDPNAVTLPIFERPLANLWSTVEIVREGRWRLRIFEMVHADLLGEGRRPRNVSRDPRTGDVVGPGDTIVTCALSEVEVDLPLIVVRPRHARPLALPDGLREQSTELESFNRSFRLLAADAYSATAAIDPRTMRVISELDPRFSLEIGGRWVLVYAPRLDAAGTRRLIAHTARLMEAFPRVTRSLYPAGNEPDRIVPDVG